MAKEIQGKGNKPVKGGKSTQPSKSAEKKPSPIGGLKSKQFILAGVLLVLAIVVLMIYVFNGGDSTDSTNGGNRAQRNEPPASFDRPAAPLEPSLSNSNISQPSPVVTPAPLKSVELSLQTREMIQNIEEFLKRYDETVVQGNWQELANWAYRKNLFVEAHRMAGMEGQPSPVGPEFHPSRILFADNRNQWQLMTQEKFEKQSLKATVTDYSYDKVVSQLNEIQADGKITSLSRLAGLLVQADCPKGRELYRQSIKEKPFYDILARALTQAYLSDIGPENAGQASWFRSVPMNLWLIEQLIAFSPEKNGTKEKKTGNTPGQPSMGPLMPPPSGPNPSAQARRSPRQPNPPMGMGTPPQANASEQNEDIFKHRLLLLQILARRGGEVSSYLMGKLLQADKEDLLLSALATGTIKPELFCRFTGPYAEPLIEPFTLGLNKHKSVQQEWTAIASVMATMFNDRASNAVLAGTNDNITLNGDLVFFLAAGGNRYTLDYLSELIRTSRTENPDVTKIFALWTQVAPESRQSVWSLFGLFSTSDKSQNPSNQNFNQPPGGFNPAMPPQPGTPGQMAAPTMQAEDIKLPTRGWPVKRTFISAIDAQAAKQFLTALGQIATTTSTPNPQSQHSPPGYPMMGPGGPGNNQPQSLNKVKTDAVRCLVSLYDPAIGSFFQNQIDDPDTGPMSRLGLCALDKRESCPLLIKHFIKNPFELSLADSSSPSNYSNQSSEALTIVPGNLTLPLDEQGLAKSGISARDALVYFDNRDAGKAFLAAIGELIVHKEPFDNPEQVADAACRMINSLGRWATPGSASTLADLIESTGDFGLRSAVRSTDNQGPNPMATKVRMKALEILGQVGNQESLEVIIRIATYSKENDSIGLAAKYALARRGASEGVDLFLDMIDPDKQSKADARASGASPYAPSQTDQGQPSKQQIALLGLSQATLAEPQVNRVITLIKKVGQSKENSGYSTVSTSFQEELVLSLLKKAQGLTIKNLASLIAEEPVGRSNQNSGEQEIYYWNRSNTGNDSMDSKFLKMVATLNQIDSFEDEQAVAQFVTAILRREESLLTENKQGTDQWDALRHLINFENTSRQMQRSPTMPLLPVSGAMPPSMEMPPEMITMENRNMSGQKVKLPNMPGIKRTEMSLSTNPQMHAMFPPAYFSRNSQPSGTRSDQNRTLKFLNIPFPDARQGSNSNDQQQAALAGMQLIARLKGAQTFLKDLKELPFYRYLANFMIWQTGDQSGYDDLVDLLADDSNEKHLKFLAIEELEKNESLDLAKLFGQAISRTSNTITRTRLADGAVYVIAHLWENQMVGGVQSLRDTEQVIKVAEAWKPIVESKSYDRILANPMIITLAGLESSRQTTKWMQDILRIQGAKDNPLSEQALENAVQILRGINPGGTKELLDFYVTLLTQTVNPERQKLALETEQAILQEKSSKSNTGSEESRRSTGRRSYTGTGPSRKPAQPVPAYQSVAPAAILAISEMKIPENLPTLIQIARARPDMLGYTALEIYKKDQKQGANFIRTLLAESGKKPELGPQVMMALLVLKNQPDRFYFDMLVRAITKADPAVRVQAFALLEEMNQNQALPAEVSLPQTIKTILQGLSTDLRDGKDAGPILEKVCDFAESLQDNDLSRLVERIKKAQELYKTRGNRPQRNNPRMNR